MIKAIAFDLGGVLIKEKDIELTGSSDIIERKFGKINFDKEFYNWAVKETDLSLTEIKKIIKNIMLNYYELRDPTIFRKFSNLKLAIASNHISAIRLWLNKLTAKFYTVVISAECGYEKPQKEFYQYLIKKLNEKPEHILFIDDRIENINAAKKEGLKTLHFQNKNKLSDEILSYLKMNIVENYLEEIQSSTVSLPIRKGDFKLAASYSDAHGTEQLKHSVDFLCKVGTEVLAVLPGTVTDVVDHFKEYGDKLKFAQKVNYITIQHEDNLFSQYLHLGNKQTKVKIGMNVKQGQVIGATGLSGYMTKPHLHFHMCIMTDDDKVWKTVPVNFKPHLDIVREAYIFSDKTISIDLDKFITGEKNKLIIAGLSGSGKTTFCKYFSSKNDIECFETDRCFDYIKEIPNFREILTDENQLKKYFYEAYINCIRPKLISNKRQVIEGGAVWQNYIYRPEIRPELNQHPVIIFGTSALKASIRSIERRMKRPNITISKILSIIDKNFNFLNPRLKIFREERIKAGGDIKEFIIPKDIIEDSK